MRGAHLKQLAPGAGTDSELGAEGVVERLSPEAAELLVSFIEHNCEHYGQLVVYARLSGIVPPASRG